MRNNSNFNPPLDHCGPQALDYPGYEEEWLERPIFERFKYQAEMHFKSIAIRDRKGCITYSELLAECLRLGNYIASNVPPGESVVIALPVDRHYPAAMLAALAAGRPYIPLDLSHPPERLRHILAHCKSRHVLTDTIHQPSIAGFLSLDTSFLLRDALPSLATSYWQPSATAEDIAYIIYTSGSSEIPKGVYQNQRGLSHDILQYTRSAHLRPSDVFTGLYSPNVNGALRDIYGSLLNGATLLIIDLRNDGLGYAKQSIKQWGATVLHAMPPVMRSLVRSLNSNDDLSSVRLVYLAGDKLLGVDLLAIRQRLHHHPLVYVGIGSTECATLYCQWFVPPDFTPQGALVPSGFSVPDRIVEILDANGQGLPIGQAGEIFVSSPYLARGYWQDESRTQTQFIPVPEHPGWVRFATGDRGYLQPDGLLVFEGRVDRQIKIRGYRVEPAETEAALRSLRSVKEAAVVAIQTEDRLSLIAFVALTEPTHTNYLQQKVSEILPSHSCPTEIILLEELPLLSNFKVDTAALINLAQQHRGRTNSIGECTADAIETCWCKTLQITSVTLERSFREEGGDSLKALELHVALEAVIGQHLALDKFGLDMTFVDLSHWLNSLGKAERILNRQRPQLFIFPPAQGLQIDTLLLRNEMASDMDVTLVDNPPYYKREPYTTSIKELAAILLPEVLNHYQPGRKLIFLGQCCGGRIAHEIATDLQKRGLKIDLVVLTDLPKTHDRLQFSQYGPINTLRRHISILFCRSLPKHWLLHVRKISRTLVGGSWWQTTISKRVERHCRIRAESYLSRKHSLAWRPKILHSPALLLLSAYTLQRNPEVPRDLGWASICTELSILPIGLGHADYAQQPNSAALKSILIKLLDSISN